MPVLNPTMDVENESKERAYKLSLQNCLLSNSVNILDRINVFVYNANIIAHLAYRLSLAHSLRMLELNLPLVPFDKNDYFQTIALAVTKMNFRNSKWVIKDLHIRESSRLFKEEIVHDNPDFEWPFKDYFGALMNYIKVEMQTATINHLVTNLFSRLRKFFKHFHPEILPRERYNIIMSIIGVTYVGNNQHVLFFRNLLGGIEPNEKNIKNNPNPIMKMYFYILQRYLEHNINNPENQLPVFSLLPIKSQFTASYITIDRDVMRDILLSFDKIPFVDPDGDDVPTIKAFNLLSTAERNKLLKEDGCFHFKQIMKVKHAKKNFVYVKTDGVGVSIYTTSRSIRNKRLPRPRKIIIDIEDEKEEPTILRESKEDDNPAPKKRRKRQEEKKAQRIQMNSNFYGLDPQQIEEAEIVKAFDPGIRRLYTGGNPDPIDGSFHALSSGKYYQDTQNNNWTYQKQKIYNRNVEIQNIIHSTAMPSVKV